MLMSQNPKTKKNDCAVRRFFFNFVLPVVCFCFWRRKFVEKWKQNFRVVCFGVCIAYFFPEQASGDKNEGGNKITSYFFQLNNEKSRKASGKIHGTERKNEKKHRKKRLDFLL